MRKQNHPLASTKNTQDPIVFFTDSRLYNRIKVRTHRNIEIFNKQTNISKLQYTPEFHNEQHNYSELYNSLPSGPSCTATLAP